MESSHSFFVICSYLVAQFKISYGTPSLNTDPRRVDMFDSLRGRIAGEGEKGGLLPSHQFLFSNDDVKYLFFFGLQSLLGG